MEVLLGPTFSIEVPPSSTAFVRAQKGVSLPQDNPGAAAACLFMKGEEQEIQKNVGSGFGLLGSGSSLDDEASSESSSSIGVPDDDSEDDAGEEVQSNLKEGGLCSLDSLEDSLPIKRGLSNHFSGKSKSFANLSEVIQVEDLKKPENPFNKRRRILMASKLSRKSSLYNWPNPKSMPLLVLNEDDQEEEEEPATGPSYSEEKEQQSDEEEERDSELRRRISKLHDRKLYSFKSRSCFDLQEYQK